MPQSLIETDYLIVGAGAMGMAFADTLLSETESDIVIVDAHHKPGGHWNDAYSFVTLHQPSTYYGVSSKELSKGYIDQAGLNIGLEELATGPEILAYFDDVMRRHFLPTGRVRYLPMHEYDWESGEARRLIGGETVTLSARKRVVDATWLKTTVPSTHIPNFEVAPQVALRALNDLPKIAKDFSNYVVCGAGKTGMDAITWLLENGSAPEAIRWIMPRDSWLMDRGTTQTQDQFFEATMGNQARQMEAIAESTSIENLFERLESAGCLIRIDPIVMPEMFHGATISQEELKQLRRVKNVIRLGRIQSITENEIVLDGGAIPTSADTLHIDCTACAVSNSESVPVFQEDCIRLQTVRTVQPVFSAALIAYVEANYDDDEKKSALCQVVPLPNHATDWIPIQAAAMMNQFVWSQEKPLRNWITANRLDGYSQMVRGVEAHEADKRAIIDRMRSASMPAMEKLQAYIAELEGRS